MKNFITEGYTIKLPAPYAVTSGQGLLVGSIFGVATSDADAGADVETHVVGVVQLTKTADKAWAAGAKVYWDDANGACTVTATGNRLIGSAVRAEGAAAVTGRVRLNGVSVGIQEGNITTLAAPYDVNVGDGMLVGSLFGVAQQDALTAEDVDTATVGIHELPKAVADVIAQGAKVYWNDTNQECAATASGNKLIGAAVLDAGNGDATVTVRLNGVSV